mgnify:CR=1 FL=1
MLPRQIDLQDLFNWRNNEITRSMFVSTDVVEWDTHVQWYRAVMLDTARLILIGEDESGKVGMVRFDLNAERTTAEVSINLNPGRRRQGLSSQILRLAIDSADVPREIRLVARIKSINIASIKCFERCRFECYFEDKIYKFYCLQT